MYSHKYNLILGFHGCDKKIRDLIVSGKIPLRKSHNEYDWLGHGMYFWENNPERAYDWATFLKKTSRNNRHKIVTPSVLGAVIDLGLCLDLLNASFIRFLGETYETLKEMHELQGTPIPKNEKAFNSDTDLLKRNLDCAVINYLHLIRKDTDEKPFDSVRGVFLEADPIYPNAGFKKKNHIQICIRNPNCIKGFFIPRIVDEKYDKV